MRQHSIGGYAVGFGLEWISRDVLRELITFTHGVCIFEGSNLLYQMAKVIVCSKFRCRTQGAIRSRADFLIFSKKKKEVFL